MTNPIVTPPRLSARLLTTLVAAPLFLFALFQSSFAFWIAVLALNLCALAEYFSIAFKDRIPRILGISLGLLFFFFLTRNQVPANILVWGLLVAVFVYFLFHRSADPKSALSGAALTIFGIFYTSLLQALFFLRENGSPAWVFCLLSMVWLRDSGVYFVWLALGGHRNYPKRDSSLQGTLARFYKSFPIAVSPNKSWGAMPVAILCTSSAAVVAKIFYLPEMTWMDVFLLSIPVALLSLLGDLCESIIKRAHGISQTSSLLPGHGGILDRFDGVVFAAIYVLAYLHFAHPSL